MGFTETRLRAKDAKGGDRSSYHHRRCPNDLHRPHVRGTSNT